MSTQQGSRSAPSQLPHPTPAPTPTEMKRFMGAPKTGVPCILETRVGLLAAVVEPPASAHLHVAEPARTSARDITLGLSPKLCVTRTAQPHLDMSFLTCNLCNRDTNGRTVYVYMSMGFCSRDCRYGYHLGEVDKNKKRLAGALMGPSKMPRIVTRVDASKATDDEAGEVSHRPTFFTCAENE
ncbi:unnamed protein product [Urochloa decumbens]|uniref:FLZ-type domain-containing protein n=1 Tax=Urochloa decumbens TaxID=240449 RepID=A0ABC8ZA71_9POAL